MKFIKTFVLLLLLSATASAQTTSWSSTPAVTPQTRTLSGSPQIRWLWGTSLFSLPDTLNTFLNKVKSANQSVVSFVGFNGGLGVTSNTLGATFSTSSGTPLQTFIGAGGLKVKNLSTGEETDYLTGILDFKAIPAGGFEQKIIHTTGTTTGDMVIELPNYVGTYIPLMRSDISSGFTTGGPVIINNTSSWGLTINSSGGATGAFTTSGQVIFNGIFQSTNSSIFSASPGIQIGSGSNQYDFTSDGAGSLTISKNISNGGITITGDGLYQQLSGRRFLTTADSALIVAGVGAAYVPYTGATTTLNMGANNYSSTGSINLITTSGLVGVSNGTTTYTAQTYSGFESYNPSFTGYVRYNRAGILFQDIGFATNFNYIAPTANRTINLPDASGTLVVGGSDANLNSLGIGTGSTAIVGKLQLVETATTGTRGINNGQYSNDGKGPRFNSDKYRGSFGSPSTIVTGDTVLNFAGRGYTNTETNAVQILGISAATVSAGIAPGVFQFKTANSSGTLATGLTINQNQGAIFNRSIRQLSTGTGGYKSFSTADTTTNTADIYIGHTSGTAYVMTENAGTGTLESLTVASGGTAGPSLTVNGVSGASNKTLLAAGSTALTTTAIHAVTATGTAASGTQIYQGWTFTDNQTSTAATIALNLNYIPTAAGSGSHLLMNLQNNGTNKFQTDVNGISFTSNRFGIQSSAPTSVFQIGANNSSSANYSLVGFGVNIGSITLTSTTSSGTISAASAHSFSQPTLAASSATTLSKSYGVMFNSVPIAGTNMTLTAAGKFAVGITGAFEVSANANILGDLLVNTSTDSTAYKLQVNGRAKIGQFIAANTNDSLMAYNPTTHGLRMTKLVAGTGITTTYADGNITLANSVATIHGNSTTTGTATTAVTVTIGSTMANTTYFVAISPKDLLTAVNYYISAQTTTTFTVTFVSALTGSINFDWGVTP